MEGVCRVCSKERRKSKQHNTTLMIVVRLQPQRPDIPLRLLLLHRFYWFHPLHGKRTEREEVERRKGRGEKREERREERKAKNIIGRWVKRSTTHAMGTDSSSVAPSPTPNSPLLEVVLDHPLLPLSSSLPLLLPLASLAMVALLFL